MHFRCTSHPLIGPDRSRKYPTPSRKTLYWGGGLLGAPDNDRTPSPTSGANLSYVQSLVPNSRLLPNFLLDDKCVKFFHPFSHSSRLCKPLLSFPDASNCPPPPLATSQVGAIGQGAAPEGDHPFSKFCAIFCKLL